MRLDPTIIRQQIDWLFVANPDLHEDEQLRADMIEGSTDAHEFLRLVEKKRQWARSLIEGLQATIDDLKSRQSRFMCQDEAMRKLAFKIMEAAELKKVELPEATLSIRNGVQRVVIIDEALIPEILMRVKREPDRQRIGQLLKDGSPVQGATLSNAESVLSIRTK